MSAEEELKKLVALAEALDPLCMWVMELPDSTEIAQTGDTTEKYKLVLAIRAGILVRQLTRAGIVPDPHEGWGPLEERLSQL